MELAGKVVVVTGGGRGIGRAMCQQFAAEGLAGLVVADLDADATHDTAAQCGGVAAHADVGVERDVVELVQTAVDAFGRIDLFCSNAGVGGDGGVEVADEVWQRCWQINVMAHVYAARAVIPLMVAQGGGYLLQTVSAAGLLAAPMAMPYGAAKHAALALAESIAITYGGQGIKVSALCPGAVDTVLLMEQLDGRTRNAMLAVSPLRQPAEVAEAALAGIEQERFLILSHPEIAAQYRNRATDTDRWLNGVRRTLDRSHSGASPR